MKDRYQVKFNWNGETRCGRVDSFAKPKPKKGHLKVNDAVLPTYYELADKDLVDIPFTADFDNCEYHKFVQKEYEKLAKLANKNPKKGVYANDMFKIGVADGAAHYVVTAVNGRNCKVEWRGFCGDSYYDHHFGMGGSFPKKDVQRYVESEKAMAKLFGKDDHDSYYASLKVGDIVHYDDGFNKFTRCEVRDGEYSVYGGKTLTGKYLKPIALVGEQRSSDLPSRMDDGSIYDPTEMKFNRGMTPHFGNIYESPRYAKQGKSIDPRGLKPVDLSVPPMTKEEAVKAAYHRTVDFALKILNGGAFFQSDNVKDDTPVYEDPKERLEAVMKVIQGGLNGNPPPLKEE